MGLLTNLVALVKKTGSPLGKVFFTGAALDAAAGGTAAVPPFVTNVTPPDSHGADLSFGEEETRFANHAPASPRYSTSFPQVLACLFYRCACFLRALCVRAYIALPCRSRLTVIQLANVHHVSRVDDFVLVVRRGSNCTSCGLRLTFSQIWRMSPSCWRVDSFYSHLYFHV
jgi:hypothetical protein